MAEGLRSADTVYPCVAKAASPLNIFEVDGAGRWTWTALIPPPFADLPVGSSAMRRGPSPMSTTPGKNLEPKALRVSGKLLVR